MEILKWVPGVREALMQDVDRNPPVNFYLLYPRKSQGPMQCMLYRSDLNRPFYARFIQFLWPAGLGWATHDFRVSEPDNRAETLPEFVPRKWSVGKSDSCMKRRAVETSLGKCPDTKQHKQLQLRWSPSPGWVHDDRDMLATGRRCQFLWRRRQYWWHVTLSHTSLLNYILGDL
jgi:hypothetical protein